MDENEDGASACGGGAEQPLVVARARRRWRGLVAAAWRCYGGSRQPLLKLMTRDREGDVAGFKVEARGLTAETPTVAGFRRRGRWRWGSGSPRRRRRGRFEVKSRHDLDGGAGSAAAWSSSATVSTVVWERNSDGATPPAAMVLDGVVGGCWEVAWSLANRKTASEWSRRQPGYSDSGRHTVNSGGLGRRSRQPQLEWLAWW